MRIILLSFLVSIVSTRELNFKSGILTEDTEYQQFDNFFQENHLNEEQERSNACSRGTDNVCISEGCVHSSSDILSKVDSSANPCDNFFKFACGQWRKDHWHKIEEDELYYTINGDIMPGKINALLKRLLLQHTKIDKSFYDTEAFKKLRNFFDSCMDEETIIDLGSEPAFKILRSLERFYFEKPFDGKLWNFEEAVMELLRYNSVPLFDVTLDPNILKNNQWEIAISLPNHDGIKPSLHSFYKKMFSNPSNAFRSSKSELTSHAYKGVDAEILENLNQIMKSRSLSPDINDNIIFDGPVEAIDADKLEQFLRWDTSFIEETTPNPEFEADMLVKEEVSDELNPPVEQTTASNKSNDAFMELLNALGIKPTLPRQSFFKLLEEESQKIKRQDMRIFLGSIMNSTLGFINTTINTPIAGNVGNVLDTIIGFIENLQQAEPSAREQSMILQNGRVYNFYTVEQLQEEFPIVQWDRVLRKMLSAEILPNHTINVHFPDHLKKLTTILSDKEPWLVHHGMLALFAHDLLKDLVTISEEQDREEFCFGITKDIFSEVYSYMYLNHVGIDRIDQLQNEMQPFIKYLTNSMMEKVKNSWMKEQDKNMSLRKLENLNWQIGGTKTLHNITLIEKIYEQYDFLNNTFNENVINLYQKVRTDLYELYTKDEELDKDSLIWMLTTSPYVINAFNLLTENSIVLPSALFNPPYFHRGTPEYVNYGAIGVALAHEMVHTMDIAGSQFNEFGKLSNNFSENYAQQLQDKMECFNNMTKKHFTKVIVIKNIGIRLTQDTELTMNENFADIVGMSTTYEAFKKHLNSNPAIYSVLPGGNYSPEQLFFLAYAQPYCAIMPGLSKVVLMEVDEHLLHDDRVNAILKNYPVFSETFRCQPSDNMYSNQPCKAL